MGRLCQHRDTKNNGGLTFEFHVQIDPRILLIPSHLMAISHLACRWRAFVAWVAAGNGNELGSNQWQLPPGVAIRRPGPSWSPCSCCSRDTGGHTNPATPRRASKPAGHPRPFVVVPRVLVSNKHPCGTHRLPIRDPNGPQHQTPASLPCALLVRKALNRHGRRPGCE